jgi:hypothetical protein
MHMYTYVPYTCSPAELAVVYPTGAAARCDAAAPKAALKTAARGRGVPLPARSAPTAPVWVGNAPTQLP